MALSLTVSDEAGKGDCEETCAPEQACIAQVKKDRTEPVPSLPT